MLDAEEVDDICVTNSFVDVVSNTASHLFKGFRHERRWTAQRHSGSKLRQCPDVRSRDTTIENISQNCDIQAFDFALLLADRKCVQQRLSGMLMSAIAGIDDTRVDNAGEEMWRAG